MKILKELRKELNITQKDLAKKLDLTQATISDWEVSKVEPSIEWLIRIADFFNVSIDYLVGREDDFGNVNVITNSSELTKDEQALLNCFHKLGPFEREAILIQIKALAGNSETIKK